MFNQECMCWVPVVIALLIYRCCVHMVNHFTLDTKLLYSTWIDLRLTLNRRDARLHQHQNICDQCDVTRLILITLVTKWSKNRCLVNET